MPKGVVEQRIGGFATEVREKLSRLEDGAGQLRVRSDTVIELLQLRDEVEDGLAKLQEQGLNVTPERTRLETVDGNFKLNSRLIAKALAKSKDITEARRAQDPEKKYWWWWTGEYAGERKRKRTIIAIIVVVVLVAGGIAGKVLYDRKVANDPATQALKQNLSLAEQSLSNGQYDAALEYYKAAEATGKPLDALSLATMSVLYEVTGDTANANTYRVLARGASDSEEVFQCDLALAYMRGAKYYDKALETVNAVITANPEQAYAYYVRARILTEQEKLEEAIADLAKAAELAAAQKNTKLEVDANTHKSALLRYGSWE